MDNNFLRNAIWVGACVCAFATAGARASVHVTYDVLSHFSTDGFSASWIHGATSNLNGTDENGARLNGPTSSRVSGTLEGDLAANILSNPSGSVTGTLKQLASFLNGALGTNFTTYDALEIQLGGTANGGRGALTFETDGSGSGQFTGGFLDFSLFVADGLTSVLDGTFFFKPQAETGSAVLSPNRGTSNEFTLWGGNWMHDGAPVGGGIEPDWSTFLADLDYLGDQISRSDVASPIGVALYVVDLDSPAPVNANPEPAALLVWALLAAIGYAGYRLNNR